MIQLNAKICDTHWARIYIAGPKYKAEEVCRQFAECGACINIYETNYIFKYGEQPGVVVEFINYPRFPKEKLDILDQAITLGKLLLSQMNQGSFTIQTPDKTLFFDRRDES